MKKFLLAAGTLFIGALSLTVVNQSVQAQSGGRDCDNNAIVNCGALSHNEMKQKYSANAPGDLDNVFAHYGISAADMNSFGNAKEGRIYKDGRIEVDGKVVATNAQTVGRENINGSKAVNINGKTYYQRAPSVSFRQDSLAAFVVLKADGSFDYAIIKSCGNPVIATAKEQPKPEPQTAECVSLTATKIKRDTYRFDAVSDVTNGAGVKSYNFNFGDSSNSTVAEISEKASKTHTYKNPGTYTAVVRVTFIVDGKEVVKTGAKCQAKVTVEEKPVVPVTTPMCPVPGKEDLPKLSDDCYENCPVKGKEHLPKNSDECEEDVVVTEIPKTGPAQFIGAGLGLSSVTASGYYWIRSRRNVLEHMLNR